MVLPIVFRKSPPTVQSFDYFDLASGVGYKTLYGMLGEGTTLSLTVSQLLSEALVTEGGGKPYPALASTIDSDLDFEFQLPMTIDGTANLQITVIEGNTGGVGSMTHSGTYTIYHVDGSGTETSLGSDTSTGTSGNIGTNAYRYFPMSFNISLTRKDFQIGDKLRLNVSLSSTGTAGTKIVSFLADPLGRTITIGGSYSTTYSALKINVPFLSNE